MAEIAVMGSAGFKEAYLELVPGYERASGHKVATLWVPSAQIVSRMKSGETADLVMVSGDALDDLRHAGIVTSRHDLARSGVAVAVKTGAARPDIGSGEAVKRAVLAAKSVVYSKGPSGIYLAELFRRWGIAREIESRVRVVQGEPAGALVARGEAELGFQQMSELLPVRGIDIIGPLPPDIQKITTFAAGLHKAAKQPDAASGLVRHLRSPAAAPVIRRNGMEPAA